MMDQVDHIMHVMGAAFDPRWGEAWNRKQVSDALIMPHTHAILADRNGAVFEQSNTAAAGFVLCFTMRPGAEVRGAFWKCARTTRLKPYIAGQALCRSVSARTITGFPAATGLTLSPSLGRSISTPERTG